MSLKIQALCRRGGHGTHGGTYLAACVPLMLLLTAAFVESLSTGPAGRLPAGRLIDLGEMGRGDRGPDDHEWVAIQRLAREVAPGEGATGTVIVVWGECHCERFTDARRLEYDRAAHTVRDYLSDGSGYVLYTDVSPDHLRRLAQRAADGPVAVSALQQMGCPMTCRLFAHPN